LAAGLRADPLQRELTALPYRLQSQKGEGWGRAGKEEGKWRRRRYPLLSDFLVRVEREEGGGKEGDIPSFQISWFRP